MRRGFAPRARDGRGGRGALRCVALRLGVWTMHRRFSGRPSRNLLDNDVRISMLLYADSEARDCPYSRWEPKASRKARGKGRVRTARRLSRFGPRCSRVSYS